MGTIHGTEIFVISCPDISRDTASDIANFCRVRLSCSPLGSCREATEGGFRRR